MIQSVELAGLKIMMGPRQVEQAALFYEFSLEKHMPADHLLRSIDRFVDLEQVRQDLMPFYSSIRRPSIDPELMIRMLLIANANRTGPFLASFLGQKLHRGASAHAFRPHQRDGEGLRPVIAIGPRKPTTR